MVLPVDKCYESKLFKRYDICCALILVIRLHRMVGWWTHKRGTRFDYDNRKHMIHVFNKLIIRIGYAPGAVGFTMTTTPCLDM